MKKAASVKFKDIPVGKTFGFKHFISQKDVDTFARLSGDFNPLHIDKEFALGTVFKGTIVHGMLAASLFSRAIGMHCPGRYAVIMEQDIKYIKPVRPDSKVRVFCKVINKIESVHILMIETRVCGADGSVLIEGMNKVKVMR